MTGERQRVVALLSKYRQQLDEDGVRLLLARSSSPTTTSTTPPASLEAIGRQDAPTVQHGWAELYHQRGQLQEALEGAVPRRRPSRIGAGTDTAARPAAAAATPGSATAPAASAGTPTDPAAEKG